MSQVTLRLPKTLHYQLETLAKNEGLSVNEYILYVLAYQVRSAYTMQAVPKEAVAEQQVNFTNLLESLGKSSVSEMKEVLEQREVVKPEEELTPEIITRLQQKIAAQ